MTRSPEETPRRHGRRGIGRLRVVVVLSGLLAVGGVVDRGSRSVPAPAGPVVQAVPVAAPASALSSVWFCAGATGQPSNVADGSLAVANATPSPLHGMVTFVGSHGPVQGTALDVGPYGRTLVPETDAGAGLPAIGAIVDLDGGGAAAEQVVTGTQGLATAACASTGSDHWYFADGTTQENSTLLLSLMNPYPEDAVVDLSFVTEQGVEQPADFQGLVIPARALIGVDVGTHLRRRARVATTVSARTGRVVAWKTQEVNPLPRNAPGQPSPGQPAGDSAPVRTPGLTLVLGAVSPGTTWWWPDGLAANGFVERYQIYNPGSAAADVSLRFALDQGSAEPIRLSVDPHSTATVVSNAETRVPSGVGHAVTLESANGVGVVAERTVDAVSPAPRTGLLDLLGARLAARSWVIPAGSTSPTLDEWVIVLNPGTAAVDVSIDSLFSGSRYGVGPSSRKSLAPGQRIAVRINEGDPNLDQALLIAASGNVVVERDLYPVKSKGLAASFGVPLVGTP
ncbi:MAG TPA: DUF5719 family protein [Acidimicrobiales bacterium]|nr:DUF5719 family protein [Acidimicrobiales bacterium]